MPCISVSTIKLSDPYQFVHYYSAIYMRRVNQCKLFICNTSDLSYSLRLFYPSPNNPLYSLFFILISVSSVVTLTRILKRSEERRVGKECRSMRSSEQNR